jgi:hypothetical protein
MMSLAQWWLQAAASDTPVLPDPVWMRSGMALGWAFVLAYLGVRCMAQRSVGLRRTVAAVLALWALVPGTVSVTYWLGLAFHAPSITLALVCAWCLKCQLWPSGEAVRQQCRAGAAYLWWAGAGVLLGYLLLLDTFAQLPIQLYAWGFTTQAVMVVWVLVLLPWVVRGNTAGRFAWSTWLLPAALLAFVLSRLPTGNLWDALLDPWLWVALQWLLLRAAWRRIRFS